MVLFALSTNPTTSGFKGKTKEIINFSLLGALAGTSGAMRRAGFRVIEDAAPLKRKERKRTAAAEAFPRHRRRGPIEARWSVP